MFDIGFLELLLVAVIALLVLGPERLPGAARRAGLWIGRVRRFSSQVSQEIDRQLQAEELKEKLRREGDTLGLDHIRGTVEEALQEGQKFRDQVEQLKTPLTPRRQEPSGDAKRASDNTGSRDE